MRPNVVVDIGNTRMKWGRCEYGRDVWLDAALDLTDRAGWDAAAHKFGAPSPLQWSAASVNPPALDRFADWVRSRGESLLVIDDYRQLPILVDVKEPSRVGIDRLLNATAARNRLPAGTPGITVSVGTAMTVDLTDADGVFRGGAIVPGARLMFQALHQYTAKLPLVDERDLGLPDSAIDDRPPGKNTVDAIAAGVVAAVRGAAESLVREMASRLPSPPVVFITGGGSHYLSQAEFPPGVSPVIVEALTLDGIRIAAEALQ